MKRLLKLVLMLIPFLAFSEETFYFPPSSYKIAPQYDQVDQRNLRIMVEPNTILVPNYVVKGNEFITFFNTITEKNTILEDKDENGFEYYVDSKNRKLRVIRGGGYFYSDDQLNPDKVRKETLEYGDTVLEIFTGIQGVKINFPYLIEKIGGRTIKYDGSTLFFRGFYMRGMKKSTHEDPYLNTTKPLVEGDKGNGVGLTLDILFALPSNNLVFLNGFVDLDRPELYKKNARMKKVLVSGRGFEDFEYEFQDYVYFSKIDFPKNITAAKITVLEVYDGSKYDDMAISGIWTNLDRFKAKTSKMAIDLWNLGEKMIKDKKAVKDIFVGH